VPALLLWAGATVGLMFAKDLSGTVFCFAGIGAGYAGYLIAAQNMVLEFGSREDLPMRIAMVNSAQSLVQVIGAIAGGHMAQSLGFEEVFVAAVLAKLAAAVLLWFYVAEPRRRDERTVVDVDDAQGLGMPVQSAEATSVKPEPTRASKRAAAAAPQRGRARSAVGVRVDDIKWVLVASWIAFFLVAAWTQQWTFCFILAIAVSAFAVARLGFVKSIPDPLPTADESHSAQRAAAAHCGAAGRPGHDGFFCAGNRSTSLASLSPHGPHGTHHRGERGA
jgi:MFS family permease